MQFLKLQLEGFLLNSSPNDSLLHKVCLGPLKYYEVCLAVFRVKERIKNGGHSVPEETIRRRYQSGLKNFFNLYTELADSWQLFDNSDSNLVLIASNTQKNGIIIKDIEI